MASFTVIPEADAAYARLCPKYINVRDLESVEARPRVASQKWNFEKNDRLPVEVIDYVHNADTAYIATSYVAPPRDEEMHPSRLGTNHRGGRPGFVRVRTDDRTLVLPNYAGLSFLVSCR